MIIIIWSLLLYVNICFGYLEQLQLKLSFNCANITQLQASGCMSDQFDTTIKTNNIINKDIFIDSVTNSTNRSRNWFILDLTIACNAQITRDQVDKIIQRNKENELMGYLQCSNSCPVQSQLALANVSNVNSFILIAEDCKNSIQKKSISNQVIIPIPEKQLFNQYWDNLVNHTLQNNIDINRSNIVLINLSPYTSNSLALILAIILGCLIVFLVIFIGCLVRFRHKPKKECTTVDILDDYRNLYHSIEDNSATISLGDKELRSHYEIETTFQRGLEEEMNEVFEELSANSKSSEEFQNKHSKTPISENPFIGSIDYNINTGQFVNREIIDSTPSPESATIPKHFSFKSLASSSFGSTSKESSLNFPRMVARVDPIPQISHSYKTIQPTHLPYKNTRCSICFLDYRFGEKVRSLTCGHTFHLECIDQWLIKFSTNKCPICYKDLKFNSLDRGGTNRSVEPSTRISSNPGQETQPTTLKSIENEFGVGITQSHTLQGSIVTEVHSHNSSTGSELSLPDPYKRRYHRLNRSQPMDSNNI